MEGGLPENFDEGQWEENTCPLRVTQTEDRTGDRGPYDRDSAEREGGFEAWKNLTIMYEPQQGIRRMKEIAELAALQNKRCKHAQETSLLPLDI